MYRTGLPDNISVSVSIPTDEDGFLDRECPNSVCKATFKIRVDDWKEKVRDEEVFCPVCGYSADSNHWCTEEQLEHGKRVLMAKVMPMIDAEMKRMAQDFNRNVRGNFLGISMSVKTSGSPPVIPLDAADLMRQRYTCEVCQCRYAALGAAFFCPACGHNSARTALHETLTVIRKLPELRAAL